jgi:dethiobiotin synthetase
VTVLFVTGTDTGVGKTVATAALASAARQAGVDVAVCKPVQTGTAAGDDDLAEVGRLAGPTGSVELAGLARYALPLAPMAAAEHAGTALPTGAELLDFVTAMTAPGRLTLIEGAGGLLVELAEGVTLRDLAAELHAPVLVVTRAELGTLNHTTLTLEALEARQLCCAGLVIGSWPAQPDAVQASNREALHRLAPIRAALPAGAGALNAAGFAAMSALAFDRDWVRSLLG